MELTNDNWLKEPRLIKEDGVALNIANICAPIIEGLGFRLVRIRLTGMNGQTLQIMAENEEGMLNIEQCELISQTISPILDIEEPLSGAYYLEVSSPGIDRPLMRASDFERYKGHEIKIEMEVLVDGRRRFRGFTLEVMGENIKFKQEDSGEEFSLNIPSMGEARLVMTELLLRDALKRAKKEEEERAITQEEERPQIKGPGRFSKVNKPAWLQKNKKTGVTQ